MRADVVRLGDLRERAELLTEVVRLAHAAQRAPGQERQAELVAEVELGLAFLPWSPLGGMSKAHDLGAAFRPFAEVAETHDVSPHQVAIAWLLAKSPNVVPIPGASRPASIRDSAEAVHVELSDEEFRALDARVA